MESTTLKCWCCCHQDFLKMFGLYQFHSKCILATHRDCQQNFQGDPKIRTSGWGTVEFDEFVDIQMGYFQQDDLPGEGFCWFWLEIRICEAWDRNRVWMHIAKQRDVDNFEISSSWNQSAQDTLQIEVVLTSRLLLDIPTDRDQTIGCSNL